MVRTRRVQVAGVLVALGTLMGCSSTEAPARTLSAAEADSALQGATENGSFLFNAEQQLIQRCMKQAGFQYELAPTPKGLPDPFRGTRLTASAASRDGYGLRRTVERKPERDFVLDYAATLAPADAERYMKAYGGTDDQSVSVQAAGVGVSMNKNGCAGRARTAIYGDLGTWLKLSYVADNVRGEASRNVETDPVYIDAQKAWSRCMASAGFPVQSRRKVQDKLIGRYVAPGADRDAVFRSEVATAKADAICSSSTRFDQIMVDAQQRATSAAVTKYEGDLVAYKELNAASVGQAKLALASS